MSICKKRNGVAITDPAIHDMYGPDVEIEVQKLKDYFLMSSRHANLRVEQLSAEFGLKINCDYLALSINLINARLDTGK